MKEKAIILIFSILTVGIAASVAHAASVNYAVGIYGGFTPSFGGDLHSYNQEAYFNSSSGIDGMNRARDGVNTTVIERLVGATAGIELKGIFLDYYFIRFAFNYTRSIYGGSGKTVFTPDGTNYYRLSCTYSLSMYDAPLTVGLSIPFWKDMKVSLSGGIAYAYVMYENQFKSSETTPSFERKGVFKGWGLPLVIIAEGEYFISPTLSLNAALSYYNGTTEVIKDDKDTDTSGPDLNNDGSTPDAAVDFSRIDLTGYRFTLGISFYIKSI